MKKLFAFFWDKSLLIFAIIGAVNTVITMVGTQLLMGPFTNLWGENVAYWASSATMFFLTSIEAFFLFVGSQIFSVGLFVKLDTEVSFDCLATVYYHFSSYGIVSNQALFNQCFFCIYDVITQFVFRNVRIGIDSGNIVFFYKFKGIRVVQNGCFLCKVCNVYAFVKVRIVVLSRIYMFEYSRVCNANFGEIILFEVFERSIKFRVSGLCFW